MIALIASLLIASDNPPLSPASATSPRLLPQETVLIGADDYPATALFAEETGISGFILSVRADGRPNGCRIVASSGSAALDTATCDLLERRARFAPATKAGVAVAGEYRSRVRWELPTRPFAAFDPGFDGPARKSAQPGPGLRRLALAEALAGQGLASGTAVTSLVRLDIDRAGAVSRCVPDGGTADAARSALVCPLLLGKELFVPGFDAEGNAEPDRVRVKIRW